MVNHIRELSYLEAIGEALLQAMRKDERIFLMGEAVNSIRGVYGTVLPARQEFSQRIIGTPIAENGMTGVAIGAALDGLRPVLFHARNDFMLLAMDPLANQAAKIKYISAGAHHIPLTVISFVARKSGEGAQHSQSLQALFAHIPGLKVVMPTTPYDAKGLLLSALEDEDPVIVLYHWASLRGNVPTHYYLTPIGKAQILREGTDITIVAVSMATQDCLQVAEALKEQVSLEVIDLRSIHPFDKELIIRSVRKTGRLLVVDTGWKSFGVSAEIVAAVSEEAFSFLQTAPQRVGMQEVPAPATPYLLEDYHPNAKRINQAVEKIMHTQLVLSSKI